MWGPSTPQNCSLCELFCCVQDDSGLGVGMVGLAARRPDRRGAYSTAPTCYPTLAVMGFEETL
jgi:hypothetical protein